MSQCHEVRMGKSNKGKEQTACFLAYGSGSQTYQGHSTPQPLPGSARHCILDLVKFHEVQDGGVQIHRTLLNPEWQHPGKRVEGATRDTLWHPYECTVMHTLGTPGLRGYHLLGADVNYNTTGLRESKAVQWVNDLPLSVKLFLSMIASYTCFLSWLNCSIAWSWTHLFRSVSDFSWTYTPASVHKIEILIIQDPTTTSIPAA